MPTRGKNNQATQTAADQSLIDGFTKHAATLITLLVGGSTVKTSDLVTVLQARIAATGFLKAAVPRRHFMTYRGVFDIDGNANAWSGLFCSLLGASCILKVESANHQRQWYYDRLVAWKNYVPVKADLSDLRERVSWFATHDADARRLAENARALAVSIDTASALTQSARNLIDWLSRRPTSPSVAVSRP